MSEILSFIAPEYRVFWAAIGALIVYYVVIFVYLRFPRKSPTIAVRYEPPENISPAQAAWMRERGSLPRALAAAIVSMDAKGALNIEKQDDTYQLTRLHTTVTNLAPEESSLLYSWFRDEDVFVLPAPTRELYRAVQDFNNAIESVLDPGYFSKFVWLYVPAWTVSALCAFFALVKGGFFQEEYWGNYYVYYAVAMGIFYGFGWFVVAEQSVWRTLGKLTTHLPGRNVPPRRLSPLDFAPLAFVLMAATALILLAGLSSLDAALVIGAFLTVNSLFFRKFRGPTKEGRELLRQLESYREFLSEVDADPINRLHWPDYVPIRLSQKSAYALALGVDLGWGGDFLSSIADFVEFAAVFGSNSNVQDNPKSAVLELMKK